MSRANFFSNEKQKHTTEMHSAAQQNRNGKTERMEENGGRGIGKRATVATVQVRIQSECAVHSNA